MFDASCSILCAEVCVPVGEGLALTFSVQAPGFQVLTSFCAFLSLSIS